MFFVRQRTNQCGLHAIQNMFKSAKITNEDMRKAAELIHKETGDHVHNHESFGGDWSVSAVLTALKESGYEVDRGIRSKASGEREWSGPPLDSLISEDDFQGVIIHQPLTRHYTCIRPEMVDDKKQLYYVDSQSEGPIRISSRLATRRCCAKAYSWEPYIVRGETMKYVAPIPLPSPISRKRRFSPSEEFMREWRNLPASGTFLEDKKPQERPEISQTVAILSDSSVVDQQPRDNMDTLDL